VIHTMPRRYDSAHAARPDRLIVAMDTSFLALPPSGIGTYVQGLLDAFATVPDEIGIVALQPGTTMSRLGSRASRMIWDAGGVEVARHRRAACAEVLHVPAFSAPIRTGVPLVVTVHDTIPLLLQEYRQSRAMRAYLGIMRRTVRRASLVLTPSEAAARDVHDVLGIAYDRIRITPLAADPTLCPSTDLECTSRQLEALNVRRPYLLSMAGFDRRKNVPLLIRSFAQALPYLPEEIQLVLGGAPHSDNPVVFPPVAPIIAELKLEDHVILTGRVTDDERRTLYQGATAYVTPSMYEGFGLTPLEAMACGIPVIAANRTSLPEVVGESGVLVEPELDALADAIIRLVTDKPLRALLSHAALERSRLFSWDRTARMTLAAYREARDSRYG